MISPQKGNSGVLSNDTLLNFGLRGEQIFPIEHGQFIDSGDATWLP